MTQFVPWTAADERQAITAATTGDIEAFGQIIRRYRPAVNRWVHLLTRNDESLAETLTEQTFARALATVGEYPADRLSVRIWLLGIARAVTAAHYATLTDSRTGDC